MPNKRWFAYQIMNGKPYPVLFYGLPTDGYDKIKLTELKGLKEVPTILYNKGVTQLSLIYPYEKEVSNEVKFKITDAGKAAWVTA